MHYTLTLYITSNLEKQLIALLPLISFFVCNMSFPYSYFILVEREKTNLCHGDFSLSFSLQDTECLKIGEFRIQSVVGNHFSSPNMEI
jgi:hypothetical protein